MPWTLKMLRWQYHCYLMRQCLWHQSPKARMRRHLDDCCDAVPARSRRSYDRPQSLRSEHRSTKTATGRLSSLADNQCSH